MIYNSFIEKNHNKIIDLDANNLCVRPGDSIFDQTRDMSESLNDAEEPEDPEDSEDDKAEKVNKSSDIVERKNQSLQFLRVRR